MVIDNGYSAMFIVVDNGKASAYLKDFKKQGVSGGTILLGEGTANDDFLHMLAIDSIEKEILIMIMNTEKENEIYDRLLDVYEIDRPNTGIAFSIPVDAITGLRNNLNNKDRREVEMKYEAVFVISENHEGDEVVEFADKYGVNGGTIIHGRGAGLEDTESIFNITIEPEKEIVMMLVPKDITKDLIDGLNKDLKISEPGHGIIFSLPVTRTEGLVK